MSLTTDPTPGDGPRAANRPRNLNHRVAIAVLGAALITATACSAGTSTDAATPIATTSSTPNTSTASTTTPPTESTTTESTTTAATTSATIQMAETARRPTATLDELVDVDGVRVHVRCIGSGETTVLLIAGFEVGDDSWGKVEPGIAERARVCSYARPGTGTSDPAGPTQTFATQATLLRRLLTNIGEPGPFVVVGHSFGGAEAVTFASRYADEVTGLVLIDASPTTWPTELCATVDDGSEMATMLRSMCIGWADPTGNAEHLDVFASFADVASVGSLGSLPMTVITAVDRQLHDLGPTELARLTEAWNQGQQRWSDLSTATQVIPVENTSHHIELDRPDVVVEAIAGLLP